MSLLSSTEIQECGHPANFCHECEGDVRFCNCDEVEDEFEDEDELIQITMGRRDWVKVIAAMLYLGAFNSTALPVTQDEFNLIGESVQDVLDAR